jgi:hypothetical protein
VIISRSEFAPEVNPEPVQADDHDGDIDEHEIGDDGNDVDVHLLIRLQIFHIDAKRRAPSVESVLTGITP